MTKWDPGFVGVADRLIKPAMRWYFRAEVRGLDSMPPTGGALMVCNHSGGVLTPDVLVLAPAFYEKFGLDRPLYTLAHYGVFFTPLVEWLRRFGVVHANPDNAAKALHSGGVVIVFPGGDYDAFRPTRRRNVIDFEGRTGYVRAAIEAGVPIVPVVSIGAQEMQWFLTRGAGMARRLGLHRIRMDILPLTFGFPFGLTTVFPANIPLPTKIVTEVLEPIDITARYGEHPDVDEVDADVRMLMQRALDRLAGQRRFPVLG
ncbi:MAG: lysophospholipid acyltransferase family protein [Actinomycetota bacterium]|nr:lysophospholipid acyltransferase family protein [Actinomycetota bacterium]